MSIDFELIAATQAGSDGRPHHRKGFSFMGTIDKCSGAERSDEPAKSLVDAAERGVELHAILETSVQEWVKEIESATPLDFLEVVQKNIQPLTANDQKSVMRIATEIAPHFVHMEGLMVGTEEKIDLLNPVTGAVRSFGWYDIFLASQSNALIIDHKFVRKDVDDAEVNRQGHCLFVAVCQAYPEIQDVVILFSLPECRSTMHRFNRARDFLRIQGELMAILDRSENPWKVLQAGDHCVYCRHRATCPAVLSIAKTAVTEILPLMAPKSFDVTAITDPEQMAVLRLWAQILEPFIDAIKTRATEVALTQPDNALRVTLGGEDIEFKIFTRKSNRVAKPPLEIYEALKGWMPVEALLQAAKISVSGLEDAAVQVLSAKLLDMGKKPNASQIVRDFGKDMAERGLIQPGGADITFLKRVKIKAQELKD